MFPPTLIPRNLSAHLRTLLGPGLLTCHQLPYALHLSSRGMAVP